ncbi:hypothetical protein CHLRE_12g525850v5 [Chlamydomonas reinhardtii]|uniref:Uncharacterized protein n=1 Tax=Chlamydomonas reinhardtii TaxID=3055 RepID=A0A2K3D4E6_CHLRE|nr:uncharacterized protein CHLRE_12g525850v5 [Chlamydomonas reinhardtii]PNW75406.1 hypothetical protein CHLRE_12g525850v5 [Chlamydomonas reinhardtii]
MAELDKIHAVFNDESVEGILDLVAGMGDLNDACTSIRETLLEYGQLCTPLQAHVLYPVLEARERQLLLAEAKVAAAASKDAKKAAEQAFRRHQQKALAVLDRLHAFLNEESVQGVMDVVDGTTELDTAITTIAASLMAYQQLLCTPLQLLSKRSR